MFPIVGTFHLNIGMSRPKENSYMIIVVENNTLQINLIIVTRPKLRRPMRSSQLVEVVEDSTVDAAVDVVAVAKVTTRSGAAIIGMGIVMIMGMVFKIGEMIIFYIASVRSVDGMPPILLDLMPLGSVILALLLAF